MKEQEKLKKMLRKLINDTESCKIKSSDEMIEALIYELTSDTAVHSKSVVN
ncbi:hypothetical protein ACLIBG_03725 [Virgibacillus sp. W0181]|uniref:hypothetical protein n=1 Tax=Virgibacillus sp. W0181 TaxID=3391581 RepID=UPI003F44A33F